MAIERIKLRAAVNKFFTEDPSMTKPEARHTATSYRRSLNALLRVTGSQQTAYELKAEHFDLAIADLRAGASEEETATCHRVGIVARRGRASVSINSDITAFKSFVRFLHRREYMSASRNPTNHLKWKRWAPAVTLHDMIVQPTEDVFAQLLEAAGNRHPRDRVVVALGAYTGLRESEMLSLEIGNVDFEASEIRVWRQKVQKWHTVPMHPNLIPELSRYLDWLESHHGDLDPGWYLIGARPIRVSGVGPGGYLTSSTPLVLTKKAWRLSGDVQAAFKNAGYPGLYRAGTHTLRRMAAIHIQKVTGDRRMAKRLLGHADEATTEAYLRWDDETETLRAAMQDMKATALALQGGNVIRLRPRAAVA